MSRSIFLSAALITILALAISASAQTPPTIPTVGARLSGYDETPSIFTPATGTFSATINDNQELAYTLSYSGLSASVTVAHIHFAKRNVAGAIVAFLCGGGSKPACPQDGTVSGTIAPSDVMAVDAQGIPGGSFEALIAAILSQSAYVNVHTTAHPGGEIRGQVKF